MLPRMSKDDVLVLEGNTKATFTGKKRGDQYFAEDPEAEVVLIDKNKKIWINEYIIREVFHNKKLIWKEGKHI